MPSTMDSRTLTWSALLTDPPEGAAAMRNTNWG